MIKLFDEATNSDVSELWYVEKRKPSQKVKNPPQAQNHKKYLYDNGQYLSVYKAGKLLDTLEYAVLFEGHEPARNDGLTMLAGHGIRTELVEALRRDPSVIRFYEATKHKREMVMAQASLYQPSPFEWNEE